MSKNLTRKGLAFGAAVALGSTLFAGSPASAAGLYVAGYVPLSPSTGEEYTVLTGSQLEFSLKSNPATAALGTGKYLKFLINDSSKTIAVDNAKSSLYAVNGIAGNDTTIDFDDQGESGSTDAYTIEFTSHKYKEGDKVAVSGITALTDGTYTVLERTSTTIKFRATDTQSAATADVAAADEDAVTALATPAYNSSNEIVFNTKIDNNDANKTLVLETAADESAARSATVTAWIDNNDDDVIDSGEYVSDARTINWVKPSDLTVTTTIDPVTIKDTSLTASAVTSPVLNGTQVATANVYASFTREGSALTEDDANGSWSNTTKKWTFDISLVPTASLFEDVKNIGISSASNSTTTVTLNLASNHGIATSGTANWNISGVVDTDGTAAAASVLNGIRTVTATDADTVTYTADEGTYTVGVSGGYIGLNYAVAGTYTAKAKVDTSTTDEKVGTEASYATAAAKVATVTTAVTASAGVASNGDVKTGTKALAVSATLKDSTSALLAGRSVKVSVKSGSTLTGTHYFNGTKLTAVGDSVWVTSDANGVATVNITSDTAATGDNLDISFTSEGVAGSADLEIDWTAVSYSLVETTAGDASTNNFSVNKNGSTTLNVAVVDQWGTALTGDYRLFATGTQNSVFATPYTLSNGRAAISVTDNQVVGGNGTVAVAVKVQKLVSGSWSDSHGLTGASTRNFVVTVVNQTDVVLLDADAATTYGSGTADLSDAVAASAPTAVANSILDNGSIFTDGGSGAGVLVSGRVANAATNVGRSGAAVTVSGPATVLFTYGNKSAFGSLTFVADTAGEFAVNAFSTTAQKDSVVTVASGSVSKTAKVTFTPLAAVNTGITFEPVASAVAGRTIDLTVKFTDKWGNLTSTETAGTATFTATGPGWLVTNNSAITSVDGVASNKLITSAEDRGTAVITVTTNINDADNNAIKFTKSIEIGATPAPAATAAVAGSTGKVYASVSNAAGKTVVVKINGVTKKTFAGTLAKKTVVVYSTAGAKNVSVFVGGSRVATKVVTIK